MDPNLYSTRRSERLAALTAAIDAFLAQDVDGLSDVALTEEALELQPQLDRLPGGWLQRLAAVGARGGRGLSRIASSAPPPAGCGCGCGWPPPPPAPRSAPPGRCSAAPSQPPGGRWWRGGGLSPDTGR